MIKNWITVAWRNIRRQRATSFLNTGGLALGIAGSTVLFLLITYLLSIDQYHQNADKIHRVVQESIRKGESFYTRGIQTPLPDAFREDFQEIEQSVFISRDFEGALLGVDDPNMGMRFHEQPEGVAYTENSFFKIFDRPLLRGNKETVLLNPNEVVVSETVAKTLFPDESALGKEILVNKETNMVIVGVMEDFPENTDFPFDVFISYPTVKDEMVQSGWGNISSNNQFYIIIPENISAEDVEQRMVSFEQKYIEQDERESRIFHIQPLKEVHFDTRYGNYSHKTVDKSNLIAMGLVALFLILTACINYINLSTAVAMKRAKEVGIRKVLGGNRSVIIKQFLSETFFVTIIAVIVGLGLTELFLQFVNPMLELDLSVNLLSNTTLWIYLGTLILCITLLAGLYPAFVLSGFNPAQVLKKLVSHRSSSGYQLRRALVVFQFVISQIFVIGTVIVLMQMNYIDNKDMGFKTEAIVNIHLPVIDADKAEVLKNKLRSVSSVGNATLANATPASGNTSITDFTYQSVQYLTQYKEVDEHYIDLFDIELLAGRSLHAADSIMEVVVNEEFIKEMGISEPSAAIGEMIEFMDQQVPVVGVVKNFHANSLKSEIDPLLLYIGNPSQVLSAKITSSSLSNSISDIEAAYKSVFPEYALEYKFFEDDIAEFYEGERKMATILGVFSMIAIFIGCIGLYGLISYVAQQKTKEVGIRKVMGASVNNIMMIFSKEFIILIIIAFAIAAPLAGMGMGEWLNSFEYKIDLGFHVYLTGMLVTLLIALVTVGYKTYKSATANPVESLNNNE